MDSKGRGTACTSSFGDMSRSKRAWVATLTEELPLTPLDRTSPSGYCSLIFGFPQAPWTKELTGPVMRHVLDRLLDVMGRFPFLGGQLILGDGQDEHSRLIFNSNHFASSNVAQCTRGNIYPTHTVRSEVLSVSWEFVKRGDEISMDKILLDGAPPKLMTPAFLHPSATATHYKNGHYLHPLVLKATFLADGLILGFSMHHTVMDGTGFNAVIAAFADLPNAPPFDLAAHIAARTAQITTPSPAIEGIKPIRLPAYKFVPVPPVLPPPTTGKTPLLLTVPHTFLNSLHTFCLHRARAVNPDDFVSRIDVLSALIWVVLTAGRSSAWPANVEGKPSLSPTATTRFCTAVNIRQHMGIDADADPYPGNCFIRVLTENKVTVQRLLGGLEKPTWEQVATAAGMIRRAVAEVEGEWAAHVKVARMGAGLEEVGQFIKPMLARPRDVGDAVARATQRDGAGVDCSVNVTMGGDIMWDIPGLAGADAEGKVRAAFVRFPFDTVGGCVRILPRVGGTKGTKDWEILLPVREEEKSFVKWEFSRMVNNTFMFL